MIQLNVKNKQSSDLVVKKAKQSGFMILMSLLILVLGAAAWFGTQGNVHSEKIKQDKQREYVSKLEYVKERMLTYAVLNPELFDETTAGFDDTTIPGPGYFPCPDNSGDGVSESGSKCSAVASLFAMGWIPQKAIGRNFSFLPSNQPLENQRYWFAVDTRFLVDSRVYQNGGSNRFAPLTINMPSQVDPDDFTNNCDINPTPTCQFPLTLDGKGDIVMVLFYSEDRVKNRGRALRASMAAVAGTRISAHLEQPMLRVPVLHYTFRAQANYISQNTVDTFNSDTITMSRSEWDAAWEANDVSLFNDYVIAITREEWNRAMLSRVARDSNRDGVPDLCTEVNADVTVKEQNSWFNKCRFVGSEPVYAYGGAGCDNVNTLGAGAVANIEGQDWRAAVCG